MPERSRAPVSPVSLAQGALLLAVGALLWWLRLPSQIMGGGVLAAFVALLAIEEAGVPLPVPGDVGVVYLGYLVGQGRLSVWVVVPLLLCAVLVGASTLYLISRRWGSQVMGRVLRRVPQERMEQAERLMTRYGVFAIAGARLVPGLRIACSLVAGSIRIRYLIFVGGVALCSMGWMSVLLVIGARLSAWTNGPTMNSAALLQTATHVLGSLLVAAGLVSYGRTAWIWWASGSTALPSAHS